jgi:hypothetical protein
MAPRTTHDLVGVRRIALDPPDDCRHFLTTLCFEALDQIRTVLGIEGSIVTIMAVPDQASGRVDQLVDARPGASNSAAYFADPVTLARPSMRDVPVPI